MRLELAKVTTVALLNFSRLEVVEASCDAPHHYAVLMNSNRIGRGDSGVVSNEGYSGRAYGFVSLQVRAVFLKIILPPE